MKQKERHRAVPVLLRKTGIRGGTGTGGIETTGHFKMMKRVALKYCGGCDCSYDRLGYARRLLGAADGLIHWVSMEDQEFDTILMIHGCPVACPEERLDTGHPWRIVSVRDDRIRPEEIVRKLLVRGER